MERVSQGRVIGVVLQGRIAPCCWCVQVQLVECGNCPQPLAIVAGAQPVVLVVLQQVLEGVSWDRDPVLADFVVQQVLAARA